MLKIFKESKRNNKLWQFVGLIFLVGAVISGVVLVKQSQDIRENAASNCTTAEAATCSLQGLNCENGECVGSSSGGGGECPTAEAISCSSQGFNYDTKNCVCENQGGSGDGDGQACNSNSDCPNDRKCQNGRCLSAGGGAGVFGGKCDSDNPCGGGRECSTTIGRCMQRTHCRRFSKILQCE